MEDELDRVDLTILHSLQRDARNATSSEIAEAADSSPSTVRKRIQGLESEGVIKGYSADIDYQKSGYPLRMLLFCTASIPERGGLIQDVLDIPGVVSVQELVTGDENLLVTAVGEKDREITPVAQQLLELGLTVSDEVLVRTHEAAPFDGFRPEDPEE